MGPFGIYTSRLRDLEERCVSGVPLWGRRRRRESCSFPVQCRRIRRLCLESPPLVLWASVGLGGGRRSGRLYRLSVFQAVWVLATSPTTFDFAIISLILSVNPLVWASRSTMYMASTATLSFSGDLPQTITTPFCPTVIWQPVSLFSILIIEPFLPIRRGILAAEISTARPLEILPSPGPFTVRRGSRVLSNAST